MIVRELVAERQRLRAQLLLVWLVPIVGAVVVLLVHCPAEAPSRRYREQADPGDDFALSGSTVKSIREVLDGDD